jgi:hypothetical protein
VVVFVARAAELAVLDKRLDRVEATRSGVAVAIRGRWQVGKSRSIKWLGTAFDHHDLAALRRAVAQVPGFEPGVTGLAVASLSGVSAAVAEAVDLVVSAEDIVSAWSVVTPSGHGA